MLDRARVAQDMKSLDQEGRAKLRALGLRFGAYHIYAPALLKPAPRSLAAQLYALKHGGPDMVGLESIMQFASSGRTSFPADPEDPKALHRAAGFRLCGKRAVRVDILERLADLIRPAVQYRPGLTQGAPPAGAADADGFVVTGQMTSLAGCAGEDFSAILTSLGYVATKRSGPAITVPLAPPPAPVPAETQPGVTEVAAAPPVEAGAASASNDDEPFLPGILQETDAAGAPALSASPVSQALPPAAASAAATWGDQPASVTEATAHIAPQAAAASDAPVAVDAEPVAEDATPATPAEPELIEVWRQQRAAQQRHRPKAAGQGAAAGAGERQDHRRRERGARPGGQPRTVAASAAETAATGDPPSDRDQKQDGRDASSADAGGRPSRRDRRPGPRPERRPDGPQRQVEAAQRQAVPRPEKRPPEKRTPKAIDPDNPFAKLMALKARMEEEGRR